MSARPGPGSRAAVPAEIGDRDRQQHHGGDRRDGREEPRTAEPRLRLVGGRATLEIGFPPSAAFNKRKAEAADARDSIAESVRAIVGERLRPTYVLLDSEQADGVGTEPALSEDELIERLKSEFDAEEFEHDDEDGARGEDEQHKEATG